MIFKKFPFPQRVEAAMRQLQYNMYTLFFLFSFEFKVQCCFLPSWHFINLSGIGLAQRSLVLSFELSLDFVSVRWSKESFVTVGRG